MGIIKLESYFFQPKKFFFSKYCQNCNRKYCEFHTALLQVWNHLSIQEWKCSYTFETYNFTKLKDKNSRMMKLYRKNWKVQTVRSYSKKIVHDFCRGAQGSDFFFFFFFSHEPYPEGSPAGRFTSPTLVRSPNWSMPGRQFYLRGWEGGTRTETRPRRARTRRISGVKATGPSRRVKRSRNQEPGPTFTGGELPCVEKASDRAASSSHLPTLLYPLPRPLL